MPALVACPGCGIKLAVPETLLGNKVRCSSCANVFEAREDAPPLDSAPLPSAVTSGKAGDLPLARLDEPPRRRPDWDDYPDYDDYDRFERRPSRHRRRDLLPHRGGVVMTLGILSIVLPFAFGALGTVIGLVLGPLAWIFGTNDLAQIR